MTGRLNGIRRPRCPLHAGSLRPGSGLLLLSMAFSLSCADGTTGPDRSPQLTLLLSGPDSVSAQVHTDIPLSVRVVDEAGAAQAGAVVVWTADDGSGEIDPVWSETDASGRAGALWTLGTSAGRQTASAGLEMPGNSRTVRLVATALPGPAKRLTILADSFRLTGYDETALVVPTIEDAFGNLIEGAAVSWDVADPAVVTVDLAGQMRAAKPGSTLVRASIPEASDSVRVIVDPSGAISITFDDGWLTTYTQAFPVLEEFQLRANVAVITGAVGWDAYLTLPHLQALDSAGWSVVSHTVNHTRLPTLSDSALDEELRESQKWISENGFSGGQVFVVPYLDWGPRERQAIAKYYRAARGTSATYFWPDSLVRWVPPDPFELTALEADALPFTSSDGRQRLRDLLTRTVEESLFLELFFHQVPPDRIPAFRETAKVLAEFGDRVLPFHELYGEPRIIR